MFSFWLREEDSELWFCAERVRIASNTSAKPVKMLPLFPKCKNVPIETELMVRTAPTATGPPPATDTVAGGGLLLWTEKNVPFT